LFDDPEAHVVDQAGFLQQLDERGRRHEAAHGMSPTQQCLGTDHPAAAGVNARLIVQCQFAACLCVSQIGQQRGAFGDPGIERRLEPCRRATAARLGAVHRQVCTAHQVQRVRAVLGVMRHADAGADQRRASAEVERLSEL
jgi:hypothetical protein